MKRVPLLAAATLVAASTSLALGTAPASAAGAIQFGRAQYDSPGSDTRTNTSLNAEYIVIKNLGTTNRSLRGWTVRDASNHVYTFGTYTLAAGRSVTLHTGKGTNTAAHRYWGSGSYIWNNPADKALLRTPTGTAADACSWTTTGAGYKYC